MIDLGLKRIGQLLQHQSLPWQAIHVAGTNGKAICAYISSVLHAAGVHSGRFTSPHLVDRWDCITLNETVVDKRIFLEAEAAVKATDIKLGIGASEFELLTATAFEIFSRQKIDVAVVEVGIGGRLDSTNVFESPLATIITKIAMDHMGFLGSTLEEISREKAGIIKKGCPCVVDGSNTDAVLSVLKLTADDVGAGEFVVVKPEAIGRGYCEIVTPAFGSQRFMTFLTGNYQPWNLACAISALSHVSERLPSITPAAIQEGIKATRWPGRMETVDISAIFGEQRFVLVDGAHNPEAADALAEYVNGNIRSPGNERVTWVLAASKGKDIRKMLGNLLRPDDNVIAVAFGPVDGMPWVSSTNPIEIVEMAKEIIGNQKSAVDAGDDVKKALIMACQISGKGNMVVAGSLYLAGDVIRLTRGT